MINISNKKGISSLLQTLENNSLPEDLETKILFKVRQLERRHERKNLLFFAFISFTSFFGTIYSSLYLWQNFKESGIYEYISLAFSNNGELLTFWKEIAFSIIESVPFITISVFLALGITFVTSGLKAVKHFEPRFKNNLIS